MKEILDWIWNADAITILAIAALLITPFLFWFCRRIYRVNREFAKMEREFDERQKEIRESIRGSRRRL